MDAWAWLPNNLGTEAESGGGDEGFHVDSRRSMADRLDIYDAVSGCPGGLANHNTDLNSSIVAPSLHQAN